MDPTPISERSAAHAALALAWDALATAAEGATPAELKSAQRAYDLASDRYNLASARVTAVR